MDVYTWEIFVIDDGGRIRSESAYRDPVKAIDHLIEALKDSADTDYIPMRQVFLGLVDTFIRNRDDFAARLSVDGDIEFMDDDRLTEVVVYRWKLEE